MENVMIQFYRYLLLIIFLLPNLYAFGQKASLYVSGPKNFRVYLDSELKGFTTDEMDGLLIDELKPGTYLLEVQKQGFKAINELVKLEAGKIFEYKIDPIPGEGSSVKHDSFVVDDGYYISTSPIYVIEPLGKKKIYILMVLQFTQKEPIQDYLVGDNHLLNAGFIRFQNKGEFKNKSMSQLIDFVDKEQVLNVFDIARHRMPAYYSQTSSGTYFFYCAGNRSEVTTIKGLKKIDDVTLKGQVITHFPFLPTGIQTHEKTQTREDMVFKYRKF